MSIKDLLTRVMPKAKKVEKVEVIQTAEEILCFKCLKPVPVEHPIKSGRHYCSPECF